MVASLASARFPPRPADPQVRLGGCAAPEADIGMAPEGGRSVPLCGPLARLIPQRQSIEQVAFPLAADGSATAPSRGGWQPSDRWPIGIRYCSVSVLPRCAGGATLGDTLGPRLGPATLRHSVFCKHQRTITCSYVGMAALVPTVAGMFGVKSWRFHANAISTAVGMPLMLAPATGPAAARGR